MTAHYKLGLDRKRTNLMYLTDCHLENVGPIDLFDLKLPFNSDGTPKPVLMVGANGSGKTMFLSHVVDALIEFAKTAFVDAVPGERIGPQWPYFKITGNSSQRVGTDYSVAALEVHPRRQALLVHRRIWQIQLREHT